MATIDEIRKNRLEKLAILKKRGIEPYPVSASADRRQLADVVENFSKYEKEKEEGGKKLFQLFADTADIGDFIEANGTLFVTKRGEKTLLVKNWRMLTKSLLPLPEKWHGLQDAEARY